MTATLDDALSVRPRYYVTGGAGSGKTTLAARLARALDVPHYDVDRGRLPSCDERGWVVEGAHLWGMDDVVDRADVVCWLDLPPRIAVRRIITRHLALTVRRRNPHPGLRNLYGFATSQPSYYRKPARPPTGPTDWDALSRAATAQLLARRSDVVVLRSPREVRRFRRGLADAGRPFLEGSS